MYGEKDAQGQCGQLGRISRLEICLTLIPYSLNRHVPISHTIRQHLQHITHNVQAKGHIRNQRLSILYC